MAEKGSLRLLELASLLGRFPRDGFFRNVSRWRRRIACPRPLNGFNSGKGGARRWGLGTTADFS